MPRAGALILGLLTLTGCAEQAPQTSLFAPGVAQNGEAVDGAIVGHRLISAGEYDLAMDAFSRAAVTQGMTGEILTGMGSASLGLGRLGEAERLLRDAVEAEPDAAEAWNNLGVVLMEKGDPGEASEVFRRAFALDNGESDSIRNDLRLALAKLEDSDYGAEEEQEYKLIRRGSSDFLIRSIS